MQQSTYTYTTVSHFMAMLFKAWEPALHHACLGDDRGHGVKCCTNSSRDARTVQDAVLCIVWGEMCIIKRRLRIQLLHNRNI